MFNEEKEKLEKWKKEITKSSVSENKLDQTIIEGYERAKKRRMKKSPYVKRSLWSAFVAVVLLITFVTSIRISPAFAEAVASLPGMEGIVALIQDDKGLLTAIEMEHYQSINVSGESSGVHITFDGIITDEDSLVAFYTIETKSDNLNDHLAGYRILNSNGKEVEESGGFSTVWNHESDTKSTNSVEIEFENPLPREELILEFKISKNQDVDEGHEVIQIPFTIELNPVRKEHYELNKTVNIANQSITFNSVTIGPLKTAVEVEYDLNNTMEIFGFEDLRLVDEKGKVWSAIQNGFTARWSEENPEVKTLYLQSNYFEEPKKLYLEFNKLMALDKEEAHLLIDTNHLTILEQPKENRFSNLTIERDQLDDRFEDGRTGDYLFVNLPSVKGYHHFPFNTIIDGAGKEFNINGTRFSPLLDEKMVIGILLPDEKYQNPIKLPLNAYPSYIKGDIKIKIK